MQFSKAKPAKPHKQAQDEPHCNTVIDAKAHHDGGHERLNQILAGKGDALGADPTLTRRLTHVVFIGDSTYNLLFKP